MTTRKSEEMPAPSQSDQLQCGDRLVKPQDCWLAKEAHFKVVFDAAPVPMLINNSEGSVLHLNRAFVEITGYNQEEVPTLDRWLSLAHAGMDAAVSTTPRYDSVDPVILCKNGVLRTFVISVTALQGGLLGQYLMVLYDITERKQAEQELRVAAVAFEAREGMLVTDANGHILKVNKAFTAITGFASEEVIGKNPRFFSSGQQGADFYAAMWQSLLKQGAWEGEIFNRRKNGEIFPEYLVITAVYDEFGTVSNYVGTFSDITERKAAAEEIRTLAYYDSLTNLPNRRMLIDRLRQAISACSRTRRRAALLFIDLDHFKTLNDTLGHDFGDMLLQQVARRIKACVRECDTVARLGGDEFVVMLENLDAQELEAAKQAKAVALKIISTFSDPFVLDNHEHRSTPSVGATLFGQAEQKSEDVLKQADIAMYQSKKAGRNTIRFFDPEMQAKLSERLKLEANLMHVVERQELQLFYQVQVDQQRKPIGAEALIRWIHPEMGFISPGVFIPLAEETGMILTIGSWVLHQAAKQLQLWQQQPTAQHLVLSVNVSAKQFRQLDFVEQVAEVVQRYQLRPGSLKLELTESILLENVEDVVSAMRRMNEIGVEFSLDDFGTGYSSLQYLKRLPLDELKIDQSFTRDIFTDTSDQAIISTIIAMAHSLNLHVIAEGVETEEQCLFLQQQGCGYYQGYLFSKPLPLAQFDELLSKMSA